MELFTTVVLALVAMVVGIGLVVYGVSTREAGSNGLHNPRRTSS
jgi:hypothetical protein